MKSISKLSLNKETLQTLNPVQSEAVVGGTLNSAYFCPTKSGSNNSCKGAHCQVN